VTAPEDLDLVVHIGLHKTATTYVQNVWSEGRDRLADAGLWYPTVGMARKRGINTREGAQSGQARFARAGNRRRLLKRMLAEVPPNASKVLISSEEFTRARTDWTPAQYLRVFGAFRTVKVVVVLRRQDTWIESFYKQRVDQFNNRETRCFDDFVDEVGRSLFDFHHRFSPWRDLVGPENFHPLSYDDLRGGAAIGRRILEIAGVDADQFDSERAASAARYDSIRSIDTVGLRILNAYRLADRGRRNETARAIYDAAPAGEVELMSPATRSRIQEMCAPINERIEAEWFDHPVPGFRFGEEIGGTRGAPPSGTDLVAYIDRVMSLCDEARREELAHDAAADGSGAGGDHR
jgi:hypothetical protein